MKYITIPAYFIFAILTAMVGNHLHGSVFWSAMNFIFPVFSWAKWLIMHQVNMTAIRETFSFFMS